MATRLHIKICEAKKLLKMDVSGKSDPYITLRLKSQDKKDFQKTQIISNSNDPVWNQEFDLVASDPNDMLLINMFDEDIKSDDKMMDELQYPVSTWLVGGPVDRKEIDIKLKKKNAGKLIFEVQAFPAAGYASGVSERAVNLGGVNGTNGCVLHIKAFDARDVLKMDAGGKSDPYLRFRLKGKKESTTKTQVISNTKNPVWNQELNVYSTDRNNDVLEVDMLDEDIKYDDKMMDRIEIPLRDHQIGEHYVFDNSINLKKKDAGHLHFEINFLPSDGAGAGVQSRDVALGQSYSPNCGHLRIRAVNGEKLKKMDTVGKSDPYMTFSLKDHPENKAKTQVISNNLNPVWNEDLSLDVPDIKNDVLLVNLWDEDLKKDDRMMNEQQIPLSSVPIGQRQIFNKNVSLKNKDAGKIHYEYILEEGPAPRTRDVTLTPQPCKVVVQAIKGQKLRKQDTATTDPYLTLQLKQEPGSIKRTKVINNDLNPVWNQTVELHSKDWNTDSLIVNMMNQNAKHNGDKMMNELEIPIRQWPIGTHIDYQEDVSIKKKKAGRLFLGIDVLNEDPEPPRQKEVEPTHVPQSVPETETETFEEPEPETETETESQQPTITTETERDVQLTETETEQPLTETETEQQPIPLTETETDGKSLTMTETDDGVSLSMTVTETEAPMSRKATLNEPSDSYCDFTWGHDNSQYSTDFTGCTENSSSLSALRSNENYHRHHRNFDIN